MMLDGRGCQGGRCCQRASPRQKKCTRAAGEAGGVNPQRLPKAPEKAAAPTHAWGIYFITRSRSATPRRLCNHLVCFHIHSHEAVICRALSEAGRQAAAVLPSVPVVPFSPLQGFPLAHVAPFGTEGTRETQ